jgi:hypothetical protein
VFIYNITNGTEPDVPGHIWAEATTKTKQGFEGCFSGFWRTELWFNGSALVPNCYYGAQWNGQACVNNSASVSTSYSALTAIHLSRYGCLTTQSRHYNIAIDNTWTLIDHLYGGYACGGNPPPPPQELEYCQPEYDFEMGDYYCVSPILLSVTGRAVARGEYELTNVANGVYFDLDGDGRLDQTSWTSPGGQVGFLALDRNDNGVIDDGKELFGNHTHVGASNGFAALAQDARPHSITHIDNTHPLYEKLLIWVDRNHNGVSEAPEIEKFSKYYTNILLSYGSSPTKDQHGNGFYFDGEATLRTAPGVNNPKSRQEEVSRIIAVYDVWFVTRR